MYVKSVSVELNEPPAVIQQPEDMTAQVGHEVSLDLRDVFSDPDDSSGFSYMVDGPGGIDNGIWTYEPDSESSQTVTITVTDPYDASTNVTFSVVSTTSAVAPNVSLSAQSATTTVGAGAVHATVSADSDDAVLSATPPGTVDSEAWSFDSSTGAFSFVPAETGTYEFWFTASHRDDPALSTSAGFVVEVGLSAPGNLVAEASGTSIAASWNQVPGATEYAISLVPVPVEIAFDDSLGSSTTYVKREGTAAAPNSSVAWSATDARGDKNIKDTRSLSAKAGTSIEIGPLSHGVSSVSFQYAQTNTKAGSVDVSLLTPDGATALGETVSTGGGDDQGVAHDWSATANAPQSCTLVVTVSQNPVSFDNFRIVPALSSDSAEHLAGTSYTFTGLPQTAVYELAVTATDGSVASPAATVFAETAGNHAPSVSVASPSVSTTVGTEVRVTVVGVDQDGDELSWSVTPVESGATVETDGDTGETTFVFTPSRVGDIPFAILCTDPSGESATAALTVSATLGDLNNLRFSDTDCLSTVFSWDAVPGADGYRVDATCLSLKGVSAITESFDKFATLSKSGTADSNPNAYMDHSDWTLHYAYRGDNGSSAEPGEAATSVKFGTGSLAGSATSPTLDLSGNGGSFVVVFDARRWKGDATNIAVVVNGVTNANDVVIGDKMEAHVVPCLGGTSSTTVQITAKKPGNNRFFLDNLEIVSGTAVSHTVLSGEEVEETSVAVNGLRPDSRCAFTVTAYAAKEGGEEVATTASACMRTPPAPPVTLFMMR